MAKWKYRGADCTTAVEDGLVQARVTGDVDVVVAGQLIGDSIRWADAPLMQLVDYTEARVAVGAEALFAAAVAAKPTDTPTALVVRPERYEDFRRYCGMYRERGVLKAAFTDPEQAARWAMQQLEVQEYWQRLARSRRSSQ